MFNGKRAVVAYSATRNFYGYLRVTLYSLLKNNPELDRVYLFLEDDELSDFPFWNEKIKVINVKDEHRYLWNEGPNYKSVFTYMSLMRLLYSKLLPDESLVLHMDVDTCIVGSLKELFKTDMTDMALAGVKDRIFLKEGVLYVNTGVLLMNLDYIRANSLDDKALEKINSEKYLYADQDVLNTICEGHIVQLDPKWNGITNFKECLHPVVHHYAGVKTWYTGSCFRGNHWMNYKEMFESDKAKCL